MELGGGGVGWSGVGGGVGSGVGSGCGWVGGGGRRGEEEEREWCVCLEGGEGLLGFSHSARHRLIFFIFEIGALTF